MKGVKPIFKIFLEDLRSIYTNKFMIIVILFLIFIPSLYAWMNIKATWDPYESTGGILVAVSNKDKGFAFEGETIKIGDDIIDELKQNTKLGWRFTTETEGISKVKNGEYYAAIIIPEQFTGDLFSVVGDHPVKPEIEYYVNEKLNAVAPKMTSSGASTIVSNVSKQFIKTVSESVLDTFHRVGLEVESELPQLERMKRMVYSIEESVPDIEKSMKSLQDKLHTADDIIATADEGLKTLEDISAKKDTLAADLKDVASEIQDELTAIGPYISENLALLQTEHDKLSSFLEQMENSDLAAEEFKELQTRAEERLQSFHSRLESLAAILTRINELTKGNRLGAELDRLNDLATGTKKMLNTIRTVDAKTITSIKNINDNNKSILSLLQANFAANTLPKLKQIASEAADSLGNIKTTVEDVENAMPTIHALLADTKEMLDTKSNQLNTIIGYFPTVEEKVHALAEKFREFDKDVNMNEILSFLNKEVDQASEFFAEPVTLQSHSLFPIPNYGSGMAPFFTAISLWVGATMLVSILRTNVPGDFTPHQIYFGRMLLFLLLAFSQGLLVALGNLFIIDIYAAEKIGFVLASLLTSFTFNIIIYTFVSLFQNIGKAICVVLMVFQISSSGGTLPIQVAPTFFQHLSPYLPLTYAVNLMREMVGGIVMEVTIKNIAILLFFGGITIGIGILLKKPFAKVLHKLEESMEGNRLI